MISRGIGLASIALLLAACSSSQSSGTTDNSGSSGPAEAVRVALITGSGGPYYEALSCGAKKAATEQGADLSVQFPAAWDPAKQASMISAATATSPQALVVVPTDQSVVVAPIKAANEAGIKIVTVDQTLASEDAGLVASAVATDNRAAGATAADTLAQAIGGAGKVFVDGAAPGSSAADERTAGFIEQMKAQHPDVQLLETQYSNSDPAKATSLLNAALAANPDLAGAYVVYQDGVIGAVTALRSSDQAGKVALVGFDTAPAEIEALKEGIVTALIGQQPAVMGYDAVTQAVKAVDGDTVTPVTNTPVLVVTKDNLEQPDVQTLINASADQC